MKNSLSPKIYFVKSNLFITFTIFYSFIHVVGFTPDDRFLLSGSEDETVMIWSLESLFDDDEESQEQKVEKQTSLGQTFDQKFSGSDSILGETFERKILLSVFPTCTYSHEQVNLQFSLCGRFCVKSNLVILKLQF